MGMFNWIKFENPLPDGFVPDGWLQTKDLAPNNLDHFVVTAEGRLLDAFGRVIPYTGSLDATATRRDSGSTAYSGYVAVFVEGRQTEMHAASALTLGEIDAIYARTGEYTPPLDRGREEFLRVAGPDYED